MSEPTTFIKKSRRERYIVRDDVVEVYGLKICKLSVCKAFGTHLTFLVACPLLDTRFVADFR